MGQDLDIEYALALEFKNEHLSVSRLKLFEKCPLAFSYQYIDKGEKEPFGGPAMFGVVLHAALELIYLWIRDEEYEGLFPIDQLLVFYKEVWASSRTTLGVGVYQEGLNILRTYAKTHYRVSHWDVIAVEQEFNITVDGFKMNGYIDRVDRIDDETIGIIDYKSNRMLFTKDELENDLQMSIYGLAARALYPWAKYVEFSFHMLRFDEHQNTRRSAQVIDDAAGYVGALGRLTETEKEFPATKNPTCCYCDHRRRCKTYQEMLRTNPPHEFTKLADDASYETIVYERQELAVLAKTAYAKRDALDTLIKARLDREGPHDAAGFHVRTVSGGYAVSYEDPNAVAEVFQEYAGLEPAETLRRVVRVDKDAVIELQKEVKPNLDRLKTIELDGTLQSIAKRIVNTPRLDIREIKTAATIEKATKKRGKKTEGSAGP